MTPRERGMVLAAEALLADSLGHAWAAESVLESPSTRQPCAPAAAARVALAAGKPAEALRLLRDLLAADAAQARAA